MNVPTSAQSRVSCLVLLVHGCPFKPPLSKWNLSVLCTPHPQTFSPRKGDYTKYCLSLGVTIDPGTTVFTVHGQPGSKAQSHLKLHPLLSLSYLLILSHIWSIPLSKFLLHSPFTIVKLLLTHVCIITIKFLICFPDSASNYSHPTRSIFIKYHSGHAYPSLK